MKDDKKLIIAMTISVMLFLLCVIAICATKVKADTMAHWANIRDQYGNVVGIAAEGDYVTVTGYDANGRVQVYDAMTGISGSIAPVYLYGGSEYEYENPGYYSYEQPGTYDGYYQEYDYNYLQEDYYTGSPTYNPETYTAQVETYYQEPVYTEPVYYETEAVKYPSGTWVDIDIATQTLTVWQDGEQVLTSRCVTGNYGTNDTPIGTHYILSKQENAPLKGADYETSVAYWMPFTETGCGIHDATWRYDFSEGAYIGNGSHGCVNMTYGDAGRIYDLVDVGTPVVVH